MNPGGFNPFMHPAQPHMQRPPQQAGFPQQPIQQYGQYPVQVPQYMSGRQMGPPGMSSGGGQVGRPFPGGAQQPQQVPTLGPAAARAGVVPVRLQQREQRSTTPTQPINPAFSAPGPDMVSLMKMGAQGGMMEDMPPYDLSDFPALGRPADVQRPPSSNDQPYMMTPEELFKRGGAAAQPQPRPQQDFSMSSEDFPALSIMKSDQQKGFGGARQQAGPFGMPGQSNQGGAAVQSQSGYGQMGFGAPQQQLRDAGEDARTYEIGKKQVEMLKEEAKRSGEQWKQGSSFGAGGDIFGRTAGTVVQRSVLSDVNAAQPTERQTSPDPAAEQFGMVGLLSVVRMTNPDLNLLALGTDLTSLGLNLNSGDSLYNSFVSPFSDTPSKQQPDFKIPACYTFSAGAPSLETAMQKISLFTEETLFYMFNAMPGDALQSAAANELMRRDWRYHKEFKWWFLRVPGTEPSLRTQQYERGSYFYFDVNTWQRIRKDNFLLVYEQLETSFR